MVYGGKGSGHSNLIRAKGAPRLPNVAGISAKPNVKTRVENKLNVTACRITARLTPML
jgi:hypothetical protein